MVWIELWQLDYYNPSTVDVECYCEPIILPQDLFLQAEIGTLSGTFSTVIQVLTPDGVTILETADSSYYTVEYVNYLGTWYANIRFNRFTPTMCNNPCFILHVVISLTTNKQQISYVKKIFDKYTQRYCVDSCCLTPTGITVQTGQEGQLQEYDEQDYGNEYYNIS